MCKFAIGSRKGVLYLSELEKKVKIKESYYSL